MELAELDEDELEELDDEDELDDELEDEDEDEEVVVPEGVLPAPGPVLPLDEGPGVVEEPGAGPAW